MSRSRRFQLLQGGLEGSQQFFWQVADKADCIGRDKLALFGKAQPARCRVQGGKSLSPTMVSGIGQTIEKSRFSRIRVAHKGGHRHTVARPAPAGKGALAPYIVQFPAQVGHAFAVLAPVHFEFGFAKAAPAYAAGQPVHAPVPAGEARLDVGKPGQFNLELAGARCGVLRKISRISWVRSSTLRSVTSARLWSWAGESSRQRQECPRRPKEPALPARPACPCPE